VVGEKGVQACTGPLLANKRNQTLNQRLPGLRHLVLSRLANRLSTFARRLQTFTNCKGRGLVCRCCCIPAKVRHAQCRSWPTCG
jgi:hypothetical protein